MLVSSIGFGWVENSEQTNSSVAYPVSIHSLRWILFQRGMYFSHQWLITYRECVRFVMLLLHQGKWSTKILYLLVRKCANKSIYCVLREHLFQFKANETMEEILPFCLPFCTLISIKWAGASTKIECMCHLHAPNTMNWAVNFTTKCQRCVYTVIIRSVREQSPTPVRAVQGATTSTCYVAM